MPRKKTTLPQIQVQIPKGLNLESLILAHPSTIKIQPDVVALILDTIIRHIRPTTPDAFVNLKRAYLKKVHRDCSKYLRWMEQVGVIESDGRFVIGVKSFGYRLGMDLRRRSTTSYTLKTKTAVNATKRRDLAAIDAVRQQSTNQPSIKDVSNKLSSSQLINPHVDLSSFPFSSLELLHPHSFPPNLNLYLSTWLDSDWYKYGAPFVPPTRPTPDQVRDYVSQFDLWKTMRHLFESLKMVRLDPAWRTYIDGKVQGGEWSTRYAERQRRQLLVLERSLIDGTPRFSRNRTNGRLDTGLTNLKKEFRQFILFNSSKDWAMLDVRTSQPYFALAVLRDYERETGEQGVVDEWAAAVCDQDLYVTMASRLGVTRDEAKTIWFKVLFSKNGYEFNEKTVFDKVFPKTAAAFRKLKGRSYNDLAIRLQRLESYALLERVGARLCEKKIPAITVHDSVMVHASDASRVRDIMSTELSKIVGSAPQLEGARLAPQVARVLQKERTNIKRF